MALEASNGWLAVTTSHKVCAEVGTEGPRAPASAQGGVSRGRAERGKRQGRLGGPRGHRAPDLHPERAEELLRVLSTRGTGTTFPQHPSAGGVEGRPGSKGGGQKPTRSLLSNWLLFAIPESDDRPCTKQLGACEQTHQPPAHPLAHHQLLGQNFTTTTSSFTYNLRFLFVLLFPFALLPVPAAPNIINKCSYLPRTICLAILPLNKNLDYSWAFQL
ncbi:uncharacterized protein LOC104861010 [Fukomys damarensis]|uniref:uncharacterized protein LOC104861010 n=1 Tax=Fukomys damarensis TaxID=885580 RepID=UPI001454F3EC|nr:uncharacterized protein LOC104861010 [Fukomys damarensis]